MARLDMVTSIIRGDEAHNRAENPSYQAVDSILGANPFVEMQGGDLMRVARDLVVEVSSSPMRLLKAATDWSSEVIRIMSGFSDLEPDAGDRRFSDPAWNENPWFRILMQSYLASRRTILQLTEAADGDWKMAAQKKFVATLLTEALAPTNFLWTNPAALKRCFETGGGSLVEGFRNFLDDLRNNGGMPSQVDKRPFKVGETIAATPGSVVHRGELYELIQYTPATPQVHARPVLLAPPQINKYYVMDLAPKRSLVEYALAHGLQFFAISWRNPGPELRERGLDDYVGAVQEAARIASAITGSADLNLLAVCAGGITSALLLGHLAALGEHLIHSATLVVAALDSMEASMTGMFATPEAVKTACLRSRAKGVLDAASLGRTFAWLRPNDLVWHYWVNNYLMGKRPEAFDILFWNADSTNLPAKLHEGFLQLLLQNSLLRADAIEILGTPINLGRVTQDMYLVGGLTDHITSWRAVHHAAQLFGGRVEFVVNSSGHVQTLVCPPNNFKAKYFTNPELKSDAERWFDGARENKGTWWDHWLEWLERRSGEQRSAPAALGNEAYPPLCPAPGVYVHQQP